jgi:hypothetical protein
VAIDSVVCNDTPPKDNMTQTWGFDDNFVPKEFTGFDTTGRWEVSDYGQLGGFGARPMILEAGFEAALQMSCNDADHTKLSFYYHNYCQNNLSLYIDGKLLLAG